MYYVMIANMVRFIEPATRPLYFVLAEALQNLKQRFRVGDYWCVLLSQ